MQGIGTVILSAFIGALASSVVSLVTYYLGTRTSIDESLRAKREVVYSELWNLTSVTPMWPRSLNVTYQNVFDLSRDLKDWYYTQGGLYFSELSKDAYGDLQEEVNRVITSEGGIPPPSDNVISDENYDAIRDKASALRTELTEDLISRSRTFLMR
jgi:hypothetical protein